ncbi:MAG TPA: hypothetical protein VLA24_09495 [Pseudomonadales bacterium]|nr:hypothetical protein [Pseudomonadales bacterium]
MSFDAFKMLDQKPIKLVLGQGDPKTGGCWMTAVSAYAGLEWNDHPECVCCVIRGVCIGCINDVLGSDVSRGDVIGPRLFDPIGTRGDIEITKQRYLILANWAKNVFLPYACRMLNNDNLAERFEALHEITFDNMLEVIKMLPRFDASDPPLNVEMQSHIWMGFANGLCRVAMYSLHDRCTFEYILADAATYIAGTVYALVTHMDWNAEQREQFVLKYTIPLFDELIAVGNKTPIELSPNAVALRDDGYITVPLIE